MCPRAMFTPTIIRRRQATGDAGKGGDHGHDAIGRVRDWRARVRGARDMSALRVDARPPRDEREEALLARIREALSRIDYGTISLTVHNARVVQLDITEKRRLEP